MLKSKVKLFVVLVLSLLFPLSSSFAAYVIVNESTWAFSGLLDTANDQTQVWFFSSYSLADQTLRDQQCTAVQVAESPESTGSNGILSWTSAVGYGNNLYGWGSGASEEEARNGMSHGGLFASSDGSMGLEITLDAGTQYIVEIVAMQPFEAEDRTMDIAVDNVLLFDDWTVRSNEGNFNSLLRFGGISDGIIDIDFTSGSAGITDPAITIVTVTPVPEPATLLMLAAGGIGMLRRKSKQIK